MVLIKLLNLSVAHLIEEVLGLFHEDSELNKDHKFKTLPTIPGYSYYYLIVKYFLWKLLVEKIRSFSWRCLSMNILPSRRIFFFSPPGEFYKNFFFVIKHTHTHTIPVNAWNFKCSQFGGIDHRITHYSTNVMNKEKYRQFCMFRRNILPNSVIFMYDWWVEQAKFSGIDDPVGWMWGATFYTKEVHPLFSFVWFLFLKAERKLNTRLKRKVGLIIRTI